MLLSISSLLPLLGLCICADFSRWPNHDSDICGESEETVHYTIRREYVQGESGLFRLVETMIPVTRTPRWIDRSANTETVPKRAIRERKRYDEPGKGPMNHMLPKEYQRSDPIPIPSDKRDKSPKFGSDRRPIITSGYNGQYNTTGCDWSESKLDEFGNAMHDLHRDIFTV